MVTLLQLQIFIAVIERGSFSAAAEELKLTQPGVSQHIRSLEDACKVRLFNRNGPHIELTEAGQLLLEAARPLVQQARQIEEVFSGGMGEVRGRIHLVYTRNTSTCLYFLPGLLAEFHNRYKGVRFTLQQENEESALQKLLDRQVQFVLLSSPPRQKALESLLVHSDELVLVLPPDHRWHNQCVELRDLKGQSFLLRSAGSETRRIAENALRSAGLNYNELSVVVELDSAEGIVQAARAGLGIGFASATLVEHYVKAGQVGCARLQLTEREHAAGVELKREIYLARQQLTQGVERASSSDRLWDFLKLSLESTDKR